MWCCLRSPWSGTLWCPSQSCHHDRSRESSLRCDYTIQPAIKRSNLRIGKLNILHDCQINCFKLFFNIQVLIWSDSPPCACCLWSARCLYSCPEQRRDHAQPSVLNWYQESGKTAKCFCSPAGWLDGPLYELQELIGPEYPAVDVGHKFVESGVEVRHYRHVLLLQDAQLDYSHDHRVLSSITLPNWSENIINLHLFIW